MLGILDPPCPHLVMIYGTKSTQPPCFWATPYPSPPSGTEVRYVWPPKVSFTVCTVYVLTDVLVRPALLPVPDGDVEALLGEVVHRARVVDELLVEVGALRPPLYRRLVPRRLRHGVQNTGKHIYELVNTF